MKYILFLMLIIVCCKKDNIRYEVTIGAASSMNPALINTLIREKKKKIVDSTY